MGKQVKENQRGVSFDRILFIKRLLILLAGLSIFLVLWLSIAFLNDELNFTANETGLQDLYVTHISQGSAKKNADELIYWWHNEEDNEYYLFLPSSADLANVRVGFEGVNEIYFDEKKVSNLDKISMQLGEHTITTQTDAKAYHLVVMQSSNLPVMYLTTESGDMEYINSSKENKEEGTALVVDENGDVMYSGQLESIKGRGNVTWDNADKKGYNIKFPRRENLLGLGKDKDWILLANAFDTSKLRNLTTFRFAQKSGLAFTPDSAFVDLYMNGQYWGTYQLCEKVEVAQERVDINDLEQETKDVNPGIELAECERFGLESIVDTWTVPGTMLGYDIPNNPSDITGGYLMELEIGGRYVHETAGFVTIRNRAVVLHSPKYPSLEQTTYISNLYQQFEDAVYEFDGINPSTGKAYYEYIDIESFARKYLVEEITKNLDAMITSQFLYKQPDSISDKLFAGPVWDYDSAIGNGVASENILNEEGEIDYGMDTKSPIGLYAMKDRSDAPIWYALYYRPEFQEAFKRNYKDVFRPNVLHEVEIAIDQDAKKITDSSIMDTIRWRNRTFEETDQIKTEYLKSVEVVKQFLKDRIQYLDQEWGVSN